MLGLLCIPLLMTAAFGIFWLIYRFRRRDAEDIDLGFIDAGTGGIRSYPTRRTIIESNLGVINGAPITADEMATLTHLNAENAAINDLTGLETAINLQHLNLIGNAVKDISPLTGLTNLKVLRLEGNAIVDLSPLVANVGLSNGDKVVVDDNPLSLTSINSHLKALVDRGVWVGRAHLFFAPVSAARVGEIFRLNVVLDESLLLSGWSLNIAFTPPVTDTSTVIEVIDINTIFRSFYSCDSGASASISIDDLPRSNSSCCYNEAGGELAEILVEAKSPGTVAFNLSNVVLRDQHGQPIPDIQTHPHEIVVSPSRDLNGDGRVNILDLTLVSRYFGQYHPQADVNGDGTVNILDLTAVAQCLEE